jgi:hypothetical protein
MSASKLSLDLNSSTSFTSETENEEVNNISGNTRRLLNDEDENINSNSNINEILNNILEAQPPDIIPDVSSSRVIETPPLDESKKVSQTLKKSLLEFSSEVY